MISKSKDVTEWKTVTKSMGKKGRTQVQNIMKVKPGPIPYSFSGAKTGDVPSRKEFISQLSEKLIGHSKITFRNEKQSYLQNSKMQKLHNLSMS